MEHFLSSYMYMLSVLKEIFLSTFLQNKKPISLVADVKNDKIEMESDFSI